MPSQIPTPLPAPIAHPLRPVFFDAGRTEQTDYADAIWKASKDLSFWWFGETPMHKLLEVAEWLHRQVEQAQRAGDYRPPPAIIHEIRCDRIG